MPPHHEIHIRFLRKSVNANDPLRDDLLKIVRVEDNSFRVIYNERSEDTIFIDVMRFTTQQLLAYLYRVFWLVTLDDDPFQSVQFFVPGVPTCLIPVEELKLNIPNMLDLIVSVCFNWPVKGSPREEIPRTSSHQILAAASVGSGASYPAQALSTSPSAAASVGSPQ